jgi:hypothetical protein
MSPRSLHDSNTEHLTNHSINHILTSNPTAEQRRSMRKTWTRQHCSPRKTKKIIQEVIGTLLYYARCVNSTMLASLGSITTQQANRTENTMKKVQLFLDYASTHPDAIVTYHASDMVLAGHSNTLYFSESKARSQPGGQTFLHI